MSDKKGAAVSKKPSKKLTGWRLSARVIVTYGSWVTAMFVASQLLVFGAVLGLKQLGVDFEQFNTNLLVIGLGAISYILMLIATVGLPQWIIHQTTNRKEMGIHKPMTWQEIGLSLAGMVTYFILTVVFLYAAKSLLPDIDLEEVQELGLSLPQSSIEMVLVFLLLVVIGPIVEELLFRGYLFGKLRTRGVPFWVTTLVVSVLFGVAHLQWNVGIDTFVLSLVMCTTRELTGTVWPSILMHMMKNGLAFYLLFANPTLINTLGG